MADIEIKTNGGHTSIEVKGLRRLIDALTMLALTLVQKYQVQEEVEDEPQQ